MNRFSKILRICLTFITFLSVISFLALNAKAASGTMDDFVERCYTVTLGRGSDAEGFAYWKGRLLNGEAVGIEVAYGFLFSEEYIGQNKSNEEYVKDLYMLFMGREPDEDGYNDWLGQLDVGKSRLEVFAGFANSQEFYNICESYGITSGRYVIGFDRTQINNVNLFVERLYRVCLGRNGDIGGQSYWVEKLIYKQINGSECARSFIQSSEYECLGLSDADYVENLYIALMGRTSEEEGKAYWLNELASGKTRDDVFAGFVNSVEFGEICSSYNIERGNYIARNLNNNKTQPPKTYTIYFDPNGGEGSMSEIVLEKNISVTIPANEFKMNNYDFAGWNTKPDGSGTSYSSGYSYINIANVGEDITLFAQWKIQTYTIHYISNGGFGNMFDQNVNRGESTLLSNNSFYRNGFDFIGWNTEPDGKGTSYTIDATINNIGSSGELVILYAQWKMQAYTIHFDANGGDGSMGDIRMEKDVSVTIPSNQFIKNNYDFTGWNTKPDGSGISYSSGISVKIIANVSEDITLYAQWKIQTYTIHYISNGGFGNMFDQKVNCGENTFLTNNSFYKIDYDFIGWNTDSEGNGTYLDDNAEVNNLASSGETINLYAQWKQLFYTIRFDANGGNGHMDDMKVKIDKKIKLNANKFTHPEKTFVIWNTKPNGEGEYYSDEQEIENIASGGETVTLYAQYISPNYTIHFDSNGGFQAMDDFICDRYTSTKLNKSLYRRENYCFVGWNTQPDGSGDFYENCETVTNIAPYFDEITLYAQWKYITAWFRIDYESNGGKFKTNYNISDDYQWIELNTPKALRECIYERVGYKFVGWNSKPDGSGVPYEDCEIVYNVSGNYDTPDLFAQWEKE